VNEGKKEKPQMNADDADHTRNAMPFSDLRLSALICG